MQYILPTADPLGVMPQHVRKSAFAAPYVAIIDCLIARRKELGITQEDVAKAISATQAFVSTIERRQRRLDVYEFVLFCRVLKLDPGEVLNGVPQAS